MQIASEKKTDDILGDPSQALTLYSPLENTMSTSHMLKKKKNLLKVLLTWGSNISQYF